MKADKVKVEKVQVTPRLVRELVGEIERIANHDAEAHIKEDDLHQLVLRAIAEGRCILPRACAKLAVETEKIEFSRWYE